MRYNIRPKNTKTTDLEGVSYWYWTYTDDKGYFNISLPRNNRYRVSFWPPEADDYVGDHTTYLLDRGGITTLMTQSLDLISNQTSLIMKKILMIESPSAYLDW